MAKKDSRKKAAGKKKPARKTKRIKGEPARSVRSTRSTRPARQQPQQPYSGSQRSFEQGMEEFGTEVSKLGDRFGRHVEKGGKEWEARGRDLECGWNKTLGAAGPFISSFIGIVFLTILLWIFNFMSVPLGSGFLAGLYGFMLINIPLFFVFFLFFSYTSYFHKHNRRAYLPISPIIVAIGITIGFWLLMSAIDLISISFANIYLNNIAYFIQFNLFGIFIGFLFLGYLVLLVGMGMGKFGDYSWHQRWSECYANRIEEVNMVKKKSTRPANQRHTETGIKRLYRSGKDKMLGGVCGGIAEYLGVDPVLIRLIWVIFALGWGTGILAYIIAWILIQRNPRDAKNWD